MLKSMQNYIDQQKKDEIERKELYSHRIHIMECAIKLLKEHLHYKTVNKRITDKFDCKVGDGKHVRMFIDKEYSTTNRLRFLWSNKGWEELNFHFYQDNITPQILIDDLEENLKRHKEWVSDKIDFEAMAKFFGDLSALCDTEMKIKWLTAERWSRY